MNSVTPQRKATGTRRAFWTTAAFYALVAFEFCYMATPFAAYFYAAYRPGLNFVNNNSALAGLGRSFLPHVAMETTNPLIDAHNVVGAVVAALGLAGFCAGAAQVYWHKLTRRGAVLGGIYRWVRHPQYTCLALGSAGLLLLWPRYVVLLAFVAMLFAYYFLARLEERECVARFGEPYLEYQRRTNAFLPFSPPRFGRVAGRRLADRIAGSSRPRLARAAAIFGLYLLASAIAVSSAAAVNQVALRSLYTKTTGNTVYLSVSRIPADRLDAVIALATAHPEASEAVRRAGDDARFITYVLPANWSISETLMHPLPGGHPIGSGDENRYRVVFTRAQVRGSARGLAILTNVVNRTPISEVVVDLRGRKVVEVLPPNTGHRYRGVPVPVY